MSNNHPDALSTTQILKNVIKILEERENNYNDPIDNFEAIAVMHTVYYHTKGYFKDDVVITALDIAATNILTKIVRDAHSYKDDNWDDMIGYATCGRRIASKTTTGWVGSLWQRIKNHRNAQKVDNT